MTREAQRIAIAEACGWTRITTRVGPDEAPPDFGGKLSGWNPKGWMQNLPDYLNDLNAMHEAEKVLNYEQREDYIDAIIMATDSPSGAYWDVCHATAAQRAKAFLRTLGKWQDTPAPLPPKADDPNHIAGAGF